MSSAFSSNGGCATLSALEQENCNNDSLLRYGTQMSDGSSVVFDDLVLWIGDIELIGYLMQVGCNVTGDFTPSQSPVNSNPTPETPVIPEDPSCAQCSDPGIPGFIKCLVTGSVCVVTYVIDAAGNFLSSLFGK